MNTAADPSPKIDVSVLITAHREGALLYRTLKSALRACAEASPLRTEIVLVLDRADGPTHKVAQSFTELGVIEVDFGDPGLARNFAAQKARGAFVALLDGDDLFSKNWLAAAHQIAMRAPDAVYHPEVNLIFGEQFLAQVQVDAAVDPLTSLDLIEFNHWSALSFLKRELYLKNPYGASRTSQGYGFEDWYWNAHIVAQGFLHRVVPQTAHFIRRRNFSRGQEHSRHSVTVPPFRVPALENLNLGKYHPAQRVIPWVKKKKSWILNWLLAVVDFVRKILSISKNNLGAHTPMGRRLQFLEDALKVFGIASPSLYYAPHWLLQEWREQCTFEPELSHPDARGQSLPAWIIQGSKFPLLYAPLQKVLARLPSGKVFTVTEATDLPIQRNEVQIKLGESFVEISSGSVCEQVTFSSEDFSAFALIEVLSRLLTQFPPEKLRIIRSPVGEQFLRLRGLALKSINCELELLTYAQAPEGVLNFSGLHTPLSDYIDWVDRFLFVDSTKLESFIRVYGVDRAKLQLLSA